MSGYSSLIALFEFFLFPCSNHFEHSKIDFEINFTGAIIGQSNIDMQTFREFFQFRAYYLDSDFSLCNQSNLEKRSVAEQN